MELFLRLLFFTTMIGLSGYLVIVIRGFLAYSQPELKTRAISGDSKAQKVLAAKEIGNRLWLILGFMLSLIVSTVVVGLSHLPAGFLLIAVCLVCGFYFYLIFGQNYKPSLKKAAQVSLLILKINSWLPKNQSNVDNKILKVVTEKNNQKIDKVRDALIKKVQMANSRDLQLIARIVYFCKQTSKDWMIPKKGLKTIKQSVKLTAVALNDLHKLNQKQILVTDEDRQQFVGILDLTDLDKIVQKSGSAIPVGQVMTTKIDFIDSESNLIEATQIFLENKSQLALIKNEDGQIIGGLNRQAIFKQIARLKIK